MNSALMLRNAISAALPWASLPGNVLPVLHRSGDAPSPWAPAGAGVSAALPGTLSAAAPAPAEVRMGCRATEPRSCASPARDERALLLPSEPMQEMPLQCCRGAGDTDGGIVRSSVTTHGSASAAQSNGTRGSVNVCKSPQPRLWAAPASAAWGALCVPGHVPGSVPGCVTGIFYLTFLLVLCILGIITWMQDIESQREIILQREIFLLEIAGVKRFPIHLDSISCIALGCGEFRGSPGLLGCCCGWAQGQPGSLPGGEALASPRQGCAEGSRGSAHALLSQTFSPSLSSWCCSSSGQTFQSVLYGFFLLSPQLPSPTAGCKTPRLQRVLVTLA